jgi:hypothetical protein
VVVIGKGEFLLAGAGNSIHMLMAARMRTRQSHRGRSDQRSSAHVTLGRPLLGHQAKAGGPGWTVSADRASAMADRVQQNGDFAPLHGDSQFLPRPAGTSVQQQLLIAQSRRSHGGDPRSRWEEEFVRLVEENLNPRRQFLDCPPPRGVVGRQSRHRSVPCRFRS